MTKFYVSLAFESHEHAQAVINYYAGLGNLPIASAPQAPAAAPQASFSFGAPTAPAAAATVLKDAAGVPWHEQFHTSTKATTKAGIWKLRKGCDETALKAYQAQFAPLPQPGVPVTAPAPALPQVQPTGQSFTFTAPTVSPVACAADEFMTLANHLMGKGLLDNAKILAFCSKHGIANVETLAIDDAGRAKVYGELVQINLRSNQQVAA